VLHSLGLTTRKNAKFVLLGRRGNAKRQAKDVREVILEPVPAAFPFSRNLMKCCKRISIEMLQHLQHGA
jgi:hypothetical protein